LETGFSNLFIRLIMLFYFWMHFGKRMVERLTKTEFRQIVTWAYSLRSSCDRLHTATTLWTAEPEHRLLSAGYNGAPSGLPSCDETGHLIIDGHCVRSNHGEDNALLQCRDFDRLKGGIATILGTPCYNCARKLISAGVGRIEHIGAYYNGPGSENIFVLFQQVKGLSWCNIKIETLACTVQKAMKFSSQLPGGICGNFTQLCLLVL